MAFSWNGGLQIALTLPKPNCRSFSSDNYLVSEVLPRICADRKIGNSSNARYGEEPVAAGPTSERRRTGMVLQSTVAYRGRGDHRRRRHHDDRAQGRHDLSVEARFKSAGYRPSCKIGQKTLLRLSAFQPAHHAGIERRRHPGYRAPTSPPTTQPGNPNYTHPRLDAARRMSPASATQADPAMPVEASSRRGGPHICTYLIKPAQRQTDALVPGKVNIQPDLL